ncbi:MAG: glycosyl transferase [Nitrospirales bacterium]|nr:MAG: glycosyl transferase [Nitrospirales bacterium]
MIELAIFSVSLLLACLLTPVVKRISLKQEWVAAPKADRWHQLPTALHGGVAIYLAFTVPLIFLGTSHSKLWVLLFAATLIFILGLIDDFHHLKPYTKLIVQIIAACIIVANGILIDVPTFPYVGLFLTIFWIVGITNALNLLDNMDGLSVGTGCIAALCLAVAGVFTGTTLMSVIGFGLAGATLGFLFFNFYPAKIFMGDSGSLFLGFSLATLSLMGGWEQATNIFLSLLVPVLVLAVPIFDTSFVALVRFFNGQAISQGGRDHTSHRMVAFGLPERTTVLFFYAMSLMCGAIALTGVKFNLFYPAMLAILLVIIFWYFGLFLSGIVSYEEQELKKPLSFGRNGFALNMVFSHKRQIGEVVVDCVLIGVSFTLAYFVRFEGLPAYYVNAITESLPFLIPLKLFVFFYFGLYRGIWRYVGMQDLINILKAVTVSSVLSIVAIAMVFRLEGHARSVFFIDWMLLLLMVGGVRVLIRLIKEYLGSWVKPEGKRLLIMGAGDAGEIALREIRNNPTINYMPIGFIDDDRSKLGREIHGIPVMGTRMELLSVVQKYRVEEILVAIPSANKGMLAKILQDCRETGISTHILSRSRKLASASVVSA